MILWCHGCKELENFVLLFAALLQGNGFLVKLDLIDNNVIAEQGGLANYLVRSEDDANYVIIVCTNNEGKYSLILISQFLLLGNILAPSVHGRICSGAL